MLQPAAVPGKPTKAVWGQVAGGTAQLGICLVLGGTQCPCVCSSACADHGAELGTC
jgi:hypothetical protein